MAEESSAPADLDLLDTGRPSRFVVWAALVAVAVVGLVGWQLRSEPLPPVASTDLGAAFPAEGSPAPQTSRWGVEVVTEVRFVDEQHGFAVQQQCAPSSAAAFGCGRMLLATSDAGLTWIAVRALPQQPNNGDALIAVSAEDLLLLDVNTLAGVARSTDGGRTWVRLPVHRSDPRPVAATGVVVLDGPVICNRQCEPTTVGWFDPASRTVYPTPDQPDAAELARSEFTRAAEAGADIVVGGTTLTGAYVAVSTDGGRSWSQARLDPELGPGQAVMNAEVNAAGGGRAYAFVQVSDGEGPTTGFGYRTDDGGDSWLALPVQRQQSPPTPLAVFGGELLVNDEFGRTYLSSGGGTSWTRVADAPPGAWFVQAAADEPMLGIVWPGGQGLAQHYLSRNGLDWTRMQLPA